MKKHGFTLVELLLVIGIFAILATFSSLNFFSTYSRSNLGATKDVLIADLKSTQSSAMSGEGQNGTPTGGWGLIVNDSSSYTQFPGTVYDPGNSLNFRTTLPSDITISSTFPSGIIVFDLKTIFVFLEEVIGYQEYNCQLPYDYY